MTATDYTLASDGELLEFLKADNSEAFGEIYNRYHQPVYRYLITLVKIPELTEDMVQEVFIKIWEIRKKLEIKTNFRSYLFRISHNKAADTIKKIATDRNLKTQLLHHYQDFFEAEPRSAEELRRMDDLVDLAFESLSPQRRKVYELCKKKGLSYREAAAELQISPNTVKEHMAKALATLRDFLQDRGELALFFLLCEMAAENILK